MPVQTWTSGQTLTAAQLTSVTNMLPAVATTAINVSPCVAGTLYFCTAPVTMTLPTPSANTVIGFWANVAGLNSVTISQHSSELIFSPALNTGAGASTVTLPSFGAYIVLISNGTNWYEIASGGFSANGMVAVQSTSGGTITSTSSPGTQIAGASFTVTVPAGRILRVKWTGYTASSAAVTNTYAITKGGSVIQVIAITPPSAGADLNPTLETLDNPTGSSTTYTVAAWSASANTITAGTGWFTIEDVT